MLSKRLPDRTQEIPRGEKAVAAEAGDKTDMGGKNFRGPTEGRPESATASGETERVDIRGDVEVFQQESLRAPGPKESTGTKKTTRASN